MLVEQYQPRANFVSARSLDVGVPAARVWEAIPELPIALRRSRVALLAAMPLRIAALLRRDAQPGDQRFRLQVWKLREGEVLAGRRDLGGSNALWVERVDEGCEVILLGRHRFADYATNIFVEALDPRRSRVHNLTRATFRTGGLGSLYLGGVRVFHDVYVDWMLRCLRDLAQSRD